MSRRIKAWVAAVAIVGIASLEASIAAPAAAPVVRTSAGPVEGEATGSLQVFRGIPYTAAPVGKLRWRPPAAVTPWTDVRPAHAFAPACPHTQEPGESDSLPPMSEDCLFLNVWTPRADPGKRPVMVFIHGGAFMEGSTHGAYAGTALANRGRLVFVNFQYRIGALGFLELADIGGNAYDASGNAGILDQIAALRWVRDNIAAFGGDPNNVTIFGESAGAVSVATLLANDDAKGLFRRALLESPRAPFIVTRARATRIARQIMQLGGVHSVEELEAMSWQSLMAAQDKLFHARFEDTAFSPVLDGTVIREPTQRKILAAHSAAVPVVIGTNLEELRFWEEGEGLPLSKLPPTQVAKHIEPLLGSQAGVAVDRYLKDNPDHSEGAGIVMLLSDLTFRIASIRLAEAQSGRAPTWAYLFSYRGGKYGAGHAAELSYVFGADTPRGSVGTLRERGILKDQIQDAWIAFARTGDPNHGGLPHWPTYDRRTRSTMELGIGSRVVDDPYSALRRTWSEVPFDGLTPDIDQASGLMTMGGGGQYWQWGESDQ